MPNPNRQARYPRDLVKLLNENIDLDALVFDTDASGNPIVVDSKSGDTIAFYDRDTGEWNLSDINIQSLDADSVNTETTDSGEYLLNNRELQQWELVNRVEDSQTATADTSAYNTVRVFFRGTNPSSGGTVSLQVDNVTDSYKGILVSNTGISSQSTSSSWTLINDTISFGGFQGDYTISIVPIDSDKPTIIGNGSTHLSGQSSLIRGGIDSNEPNIDTVELDLGQSPEEATIEIWGKVV